MNPSQFQNRKACYRCERPVEVSPQEMSNGQKHTCCDQCRRILADYDRAIGSAPPLATVPLTEDPTRAPAQMTNQP